MIYTSDTELPEVITEDDIRGAAIGATVRIGDRTLITPLAADLARERHIRFERVVLMSRGSIMADGPKREVLVESRLSTLFGCPVDLSERDGYYNLW